jgi:hypothetical protein
MAKTVAELTAELKKLTKAHDVIVKENEEKIAAQAETIESLKKKATEERKAKAAEDKKSWKDRIKAAPHKWVQVFNTGLAAGVDFAFNFEGQQIRLISGEPVFLSEIIINHLKQCRRPIVKLKQGEAGTKVKVHGFHYNFNVVNCEDPTLKAEAPETETVAV